MKVTYAQALYPRVLSKYTPSNVIIDPEYKNPILMRKNPDAGEIKNRIPHILDFMYTLIYFIL
jgi:hypothetical protein